MPYMTNGKRDYKKEDAWDKAHPGRAKARAERHKARKELGLKVGDKRDAGHIKALGKGGDNKKSNLAPQSRSANRSFSRNADGSMKSEKSKKEAAAHKKGGAKKGY